MKSLRISTSLAILALTMSGANAQERDFSKIEIATTDLGRGVYLLTGEGGNITIAAAKDGVIMVDTQFAPLAEKIEAAVARISAAPLRYVINTHMHGDHVGGNSHFAAKGALIVSHEVMRISLVEGSSRLDGSRVPPAEASARPVLSYSTVLSLHLDGQTARLIHPQPSHTDGDTYVFFPEANVLATRDLFSTDRYPFIDVANGGGIHGMIAATDALLAQTNDATKIVPGHGKLATRADLADYRKHLADWRDRVSALKLQGKSEDEAAAAKPLRAYDPRYARTPELPERTVRLIYRSL